MNIHHLTKIAVLYSLMLSQAYIIIELPSDILILTVYGGTHLIFISEIGIQVALHNNEYFVIKE